MSRSRRWGPASLGLRPGHQPRGPTEMVERIALLTWNRPEDGAGAGRRVHGRRAHRRARRGGTPEGRRVHRQRVGERDGRPCSCARSSDTTRPRGSSCWSEIRTARRLDLERRRDPPRGRAPDGTAAWHRLRGQGRRPARAARSRRGSAGHTGGASEKELDRAKAKELAKGADELRRKSPLIADDGRSLVITGHLATQDVEDDGGAAAEDAKRADRLRALRRRHRRLRAQLQRGQRPDARRT